MKVVLLLLLLSAILVSCTNENDNGNDYSKATVIIKASDGSEINIDAQVPLKQELFFKGLMGRKKLGENEGMLFAFADSAPRSFWMKDTLIPLDLIFITENLTIAKISHAVPCESDPCATYPSGMPVKYVLEIKGGLADEKGVKEGGAVKFVS